MAFWNRGANARIAELKAQVVHLREATADQLIATGSLGGYGGWIDPIDGDIGFSPAGGPVGRPVPWWTLERLRAYSTNAYRMNPMARAIIDTYTAFCVGDKGVQVQCANDDVRKIVDEFWLDPKNRMFEQDLALRAHMMNGETVYELMSGPSTGVVRRSVVDPARIYTISLENGNPLWPSTLTFRLPDGSTKELTVAQIDDLSGLRSGNAMFWASWKALETDVRGWPFLAPIIDWLDYYDSVMSNLVDRTAMMRYIFAEVIIDGDQTAVDDWLAKRKQLGLGMPRSSGLEAHNKAIEWKLNSAQVGAVEDTTTAAAILTSIASGAGISKPWLAEGEGANRATALTMAEPVRRRVGAVQNVWLAYQTEMVRFVVDQAVRAHRLPEMVPATNEVAGRTQSEMVKASETVRVTGPEIAAQDAQISAQILLQLSQALQLFRAAGVLSKDACSIAAKKAWEDFVGLPYSPELDDPEGSKVDDLADEISQLPPGASGVTKPMSPSDTRGMRGTPDMNGTMQRPPALSALANTR